MLDAGERPNDYFAVEQITCRGCGAVIAKGPWHSAEEIPPRLAGKRESEVDPCPHCRSRDRKIMSRLEMDMGDERWGWMIEQNPRALYGVTNERAGFLALLIAIAALIGTLTGSVLWTVVALVVSVVILAIPKARDLLMRSVDRMIGR